MSAFFPVSVEPTPALRLSPHQNDRLARFHVQVPAFAAALVLLLNIWSAKLAGFSFDLTKEIGDVHKAMQAIKSYEDRYTPFIRLY